MNACKLCIAKGVEEAAVTFETDADFYAHVLSEHDVEQVESLGVPDDPGEVPEQP